MKTLFKIFFSVLFCISSLGAQVNLHKTSDQNSLKQKLFKERNCLSNHISNLSKIIEDENWSSSHADKTKQQAIKLRNNLEILQHNVNISIDLGIHTEGNKHCHLKHLEDYQNIYDDIIQTYEPIPHFE